MVTDDPGSVTTSTTETSRESHSDATAMHRRRALMVYIKPSWFFAKVFNRITLATGALNSVPMTVITRGGKLPQTIPMTPVDVDGVTYLVSVRGETEWVKNVRANPHVKLTKSGATDYLATETPVEARKPILQAYQATASKATARLFRRLPHDADHPVFALTPASLRQNRRESN
jgi:hypothetical protein